MRVDESRLQKRVEFFSGQGELIVLSKHILDAVFIFCVYLSEFFAP